MNIIDITELEKSLFKLMINKKNIKLCDNNFSYYCDQFEIVRNEFILDKLSEWQLLKEDVSFNIFYSSSLKSDLSDLLINQILQK